MSSALITGSFDPITLGHVDIIRRTAKIFDSVTVCVFVNTEKKTMFTAEQCREMIGLAVKDIPNCRADSTEMTVAGYAKQGGYTAIVRGIRGESDVEYELMVADVNRKICGIETIFMPAEWPIRSIRIWVSLSTSENRPRL